MNLIRKLTFVVLLSAFLLSACGGATATPADADAIMTAGVGTMVAAFFETQTALATPATPTPNATITPALSNPLLFSPTPFASPTRIFFTPTFGVIGTPTRTGTLPTATVNPGSLAYGCNNLAFIRHVTISEGTVLQKNENFTKTWKVENTGTCQWMYQYVLMHAGGNDFGGGSIKLNRGVAVGDWVEISINLDAPGHAGTYNGSWRLSDGGGNMFGATLTVSIEVEEPTAVPPTATTAPTSTDTPTSTP